MAIIATNIEWFYDPATYIRGYGVWHVQPHVWSVVTEDNSTPKSVLKVLTTVSDRQTAIGFIKLLKEN